MPRPPHQVPGHAPPCRQHLAQQSGHLVVQHCALKATQQEGGGGQDAKGSAPERILGRRRMLGRKQPHHSSSIDATSPMQCVLPRDSFMSGPGSSKGLQMHCCLQTAQHGCVTFGCVTGCMLSCSAGYFFCSTQCMQSAEMQRAEQLPVSFAGTLIPAMTSCARIVIHCTSSLIHVFAHSTIVLTVHIPRSLCRGPLSRSCSLSKHQPMQE